MSDAALDQIKGYLREYSSIKYQEEKAAIVVEPTDPTGFKVSFALDGKFYHLVCGSWHHHFGKAEKDEAISCFMRSLTKEYRVMEMLRGKFPYKWSLQRQTENGWQTVQETGLLFFPFWLKKNTRYFQNNWIRRDK